VAYLRVDVLEKTTLLCCYTTEFLGVVRQEVNSPDMLRHPRYIAYLVDIDKCRFMHFGYNNPKAVYYMDGMQLMDVSGEKDLGVIVSQDLKWEKQCSAVVCTAKIICSI